MSQSSAISRLIFAEAARRGLHLALADLSTDLFDLDGIERDRQSLTCLRSVLMKPEHREWVDRIWDVLDASTDHVTNRTGQ